jgi:hypothetical protein
MHLREAGHEVITYAFLQPEVNFLRVNWDIRRLPVVGYARPWVSYYDFSDFRIQEIAELATKEFWNFLQDSRTFDELLADYKLTQSYERAVAVGKEFVNSGEFNTRATFWFPTWGIFKY